MRSVLVSLMTAIMATIGLVPVASAETPVVEYWEGARAPGLNLTAIEATRVVVIATVRVPKGATGRITSYGPMTLLMQNGRERVAEGRRVNGRVITFRWRIGKMQKIAAASRRGTWLYYETSQDAPVRIRLQRVIYGPDC